MSRLFRFWKLTNFQIKTVFTSSSVDFVNVSRTGNNTFESANLWAPYAERPAFGGQLSAQSLAAGLETVPQDRLPNSLYTTYYNAGNLDKKITYTVESMKEGKNVSNRKVYGTQDDKLICVTTISAMKELKSNENFTYQDGQIRNDKYVPLQEYVADELLSMEKRIDSKEMFDDLIKRQYYYSLKKLKMFRGTFNIDVGNIIDNKRQFKIKIIKDYASQKELSILLTLLSDMFTIETALLNYDLSVFSKEVDVVCSMDHKINFLNVSPPKDNEIYYLIWCNNIYNSTAIIEGKIVDKDGEIMCTTNQQAMVSLKK